MGAFLVTVHTLVWLLIVPLVADQQRPSREHPTFARAAALPLVAAQASVAHDSVEDPVPALKRSIGRYQRRWRDLWQRSINENDSLFLNVALALADDSGGISSARLLRTYAISCAVGFFNPHYIFTPRPIGRENRIPPIPLRRNRPSVTSLEFLDQAQFPRRNTRSTTRVSARGNEVHVCPHWIPEDAFFAPDESEWLDFALPLKMRPTARAMRDTVIQQLESALAANPENDWVVGQHIRFLLDNRDTDRARAAATTCRAEQSWCDALRGLVHSSLGELPEAERYFRRHLHSLPAMRGAECADTSARVLLPQNERLANLSIKCDAWEQTAERLWWLSNPLWTTESNERFVEHYARVTSLALRTALDEDERYIWRKTAAGDALREVIIRYGWPSHTVWGGSFADERLATYSLDSLRNQAEYPYTVKEYSRDRVAFVPSMDAIRNPFNASDADWKWSLPDDLRWDQWWPAEHMTPRTHLRRLPPGQMLLLRRDSVLRIAFAIDDPIHEMDPTVRSEPRVTLIQSTGPQDLRRISDTTVSFGFSLRVDGSISPESSLLSLEVANRVPTEPAHRKRFGIRPPPPLSRMQPGAVAVSDPAFLLLPQFDAPPPTHPDSAIARLTGSTQLPRDVPLALYWESYGFALGDTVDVEVRIARRDGSALRSLASRFGLADAQNDSISIRWREPDPGRNARDLGTVIPGVARGLAVNIRNLVPGNYAFIVAMRRTDGATATGERRVEIVQ